SPARSSPRWKNSRSASIAWWKDRPALRTRSGSPPRRSRSSSESEPAGQIRDQLGPAALEQKGGDDGREAPEQKARDRGDRDSRLVARASGEQAAAEDHRRRRDQDRAHDHLAGERAQTLERALLADPVRDAERDPD